MAAHNSADIAMAEMDAEVLPNIDLYGINPEGPVPVEDHRTVEVNEIQNLFSQYVFQELRSYFIYSSVFSICSNWKRNLHITHIYKQSLCKLIR